MSSVWYIFSYCHNNDRYSNAEVQVSGVCSLALFPHSFRALFGLFCILRLCPFVLMSISFSFTFLSQCALCSEWLQNKFVYYCFWGCYLKKSQAKKEEKKIIRIIDGGCWKWALVLQIATRKVRHISHYWNPILQLIIVITSWKLLKSRSNAFPRNAHCRKTIVSF